MSKTAVNLFRHSDILFDKFPPLSEWEVSDLRTFALPLPPNLVRIRDTTDFPVRTLSIPRLAESYLLLHLRDEKIETGAGALWLSIALYFPMYIDPNRALGIAECIKDEEAKKLYREVSG